ncbi:50S ribosomal protein L25/general stress protein Ctc [bacterium]|nr:50S ribosomal protein L25/general stress protein Ctc [bacterium]
MAIKINIVAEERDGKGKGAARKIRAQGSTPAIIYGGSNGPVPVSFKTRDFLKLVHGKSHESMIFKVDIAGKNRNYFQNVIIKEMQFDPVKSILLHVDFFEISMDQTIQVHVPIESKGDAIGVKEEGGLLDHAAREILIECLPDDLPEKIEIDVSNLKLGESIHVKDVALPSGIKSVENPDKLLFTIIHKLKAKEELVAEVAEEKAQAEPEVLTKKKPEEAKNE